MVILVIFFIKREEKKKERPKTCPVCKKNWLHYEISDNYKVKHTVRLCWRDSAFDIWPEDTELAVTLDLNPILILDLYKMKQLKPVKENANRIS